MKLPTIISPTRPPRRGNSAYTIIEALVYIGAVFLVLGIGYSALYRCIEHSVSLRRNAADIASALQAGERWRADIRAATSPPRLESTDASQVLILPGARGEVQYAFVDGAVLRRIGAGPWVSQLTNVVVSQMESAQRRKVTSWKWELELRSQVKVPQVKPLFTFLAAPPASTAK